LKFVKICLESKYEVGIHKQKKLMMNSRGCRVHNSRYRLYRAYRALQSECWRIRLSITGWLRGNRCGC